MFDRYCINNAISQAFPDMEPITAEEHRTLMEEFKYEKQKSKNNVDK